MATPRHSLSADARRNHLDSLDARNLADSTEVMPRLSWFRKRKRKRHQEQQIIHWHSPPANPVPSEPLDRGTINEAINKYGWIELPMRTIECRDCSNTFTWEYSPGIGRPPIRCVECREKNKAKTKTPKNNVEVETNLSGVALADRLDFNLRASGNHISQHRKDWE